MRRMIAGPTVVAVLFAFWGSPFFHLHAATAGARHHGAVEFDHETLIHAHLPAAAARHSTATLSDTEEDEKPLDIFRAVPSTGAGIVLPFVVAVRAVLTPPAVRPAHVFSSLSPRAHDPPSLEQLVPRAPPA